MIRDTIAEIEKKIEHAEAVSDQRKAELLRLLATLRSEIGELSKTHQHQAETIAELARASAEEATAVHSGRTPAPSAVDHLAASVTDFETSHPRLVEVVNRICVTLANLGI